MTSNANTLSGSNQPVTVSDAVVRLKVTGLDVKGRMFRHLVTVIRLDGADCTFRSQSQPELNGSILAEFDYPGVDPKCRVSPGSVKSTHAEIDGTSYAVEVKLDVAQTAKVVPAPIEFQAAAQEPMLSADPIAAEGSEGDPCQFSDVMGAEDLMGDRDAVKLAIMSEMQQQMPLFRSLISGELEKALPAIVSLNMEKMCHQVAEQVAASKDLRSVLEHMMAQVFQEQASHLQIAAAERNPIRVQAGWRSPLNNLLQR